MASKTCSRCQQVKSLDDFHRLRASKDGRHAHCKSCRSEYRRAQYQANSAPKLAKDKAHRQRNPVQYLLAYARKRARSKGLPFALTVDDVYVPDICPVLGIPLLLANGIENRSNSPSLDKIVPEIGYVPGNVQVISYKANAMKQNASREELLAFADWIYKTQGGEHVG